MSNVYLENETFSGMPPANLAAARVAILMCTKDGTAFIDDQLKSIAEQTHKNWTLIISDDGSVDDTVLKIKRFAEAHSPKIMITNGPGNGVCANFLSLTNDPTIDGDYFAFSDQDDIWYQDKLHRAITWLATIPADVPGMYCGRTELMTFDELPVGLSPLFSRPPSFQNALIQSLAGGNSMVFNRAAKKKLEEAATNDVVLHDWWVYQLVSAVGGKMYYDPQPMLRYRQHPRNLIGSNSDWFARFVRFRMTLSGRFRRWNDMNIAALRRLPAHLITPRNSEVLELFMTARSSSLLKRLYLLKKSGVYRQTLLGNFGLIAATILKRI